MGGIGSGHFLPRPTDTLLAEHAETLFKAGVAYQDAADRLEDAIRAALDAGCPVVWMSERLGCSPQTVTRIKRGDRPDRWGMPMRIYDDRGDGSEAG